MSAITNPPTGTVAAPGNPTTTAASRTRSTSWWPTVLRLAFGVVFTIDAVLKWLPGYRHSFIGQVPTSAGQPGWLHWWFNFWHSLNTSAPTLFVDLTILAETGLAIVLIFGIARRAGYIAGAVYMLFVWGVGEAFGGPYSSGATDIGAGIIYTLLFLLLLTVMPAARNERLSLDTSLVQRVSWWRHVAEPFGAGN
jgi:uncharacterized membrane protein YphA (DoxX/SURF4 family)